jgi:translation initiation factor IF-3
MALSVLANGAAYFYPKEVSKASTMANEAVRTPKVRLIDGDESMGVVSIREALDRANEAELICRGCT